MNMTDSNIAIRKMMAWHELRNKILTKESFTHREYKMIGKLLAACEGSIYPSLRQINNYKLNFQQMICTDQKEAFSSFNEYAEKVAEMEEKFIRPYDNIFRPS
ncbi:hypothetical protein CWD77_09440 [Rhodohalobacter barkolensis]|uniref:Uncharacterized protein n=2 Tax=Rhodohalobacter barkolensis TaxID=2053187 RepID=A0A2N0VHV5_9BACT|nr:hypothetical protein CWD77_09440 [Rhodohalobacter barkolensis]